MRLSLARSIFKNKLDVQMQNNFWKTSLIVFTLSFSVLCTVSAEFVDIGGGRLMFIECQGSGSPTVVLVSGRSDRATIWNTVVGGAKEKSTVFSEVSKFTRVCAYDRPGTITVTEQDVVKPSRSSSVSQPTTAKSGMEDLHALLKAANVAPPYVLVGHSYAGLIVRLYASTYPEEVSGLVLIDTLTELLFDYLSSAQQSLWIRLNSHYSPEVDKYTIQERIDFLPTFEQVRRASCLKAMPVVILTSDKSYDFKSLISLGVLPGDTPLDFEAVVFKAHLRSQKKLAELLHAKQIDYPHAGHYIHLEQPQIVVQAIRDVVGQVRKNKVKN